MDLLEGLEEIDEELARLKKNLEKSMKITVGKALKEEKLSANEMEVLLLLSHDRCDTAREISRHRGLSRSLVSKAVDSLLKRGYLAFRPDEKDRRVIHLLLLPKAEETVKQLSALRREHMINLCEGITAQEAEAFHRIVRKMSENAERKLKDESLLHREREGSK